MRDWGIAALVLGVAILGAWFLLRSKGPRPNDPEIVIERGKLVDAIGRGVRNALTSSDRVSRLMAAIRTNLAANVTLDRATVDRAVEAAIEAAPLTKRSRQERVRSFVAVELDAYYLDLERRREGESKGESEPDAIADHSGLMAAFRDGIGDALDDANRRRRVVDAVRVLLAREPAGIGKGRAMNVLEQAFIDAPLTKGSRRDRVREKVSASLDRFYA